VPLTVTADIAALRIYAKGGSDPDSRRRETAIVRHIENAAAAPAPPHFGCGGEPRPRVPSETGNDHKNLLHARRRHLCLEPAFAVDPDCDGWSVTLNGVDVPFWVSWIAVTVAGALSFVGFRAAMRS